MAHNQGIQVFSDQQKEIDTQLAQNCYNQSLSIYGSCSCKRTWTKIGAQPTDISINTICLQLLEQSRQLRDENAKLRQQVYRLHNRLIQIDPEYRQIMNNQQRNVQVNNLPQDKVNGHQQEEENNKNAKFRQ